VREVPLQMIVERDQRRPAFVAGFLQVGDTLLEPGAARRSRYADAKLFNVTSTAQAPFR
jgi:hypothetical protein